MGRSTAAALILCAWLACSASACSTFLHKCPQTGDVPVSGRTIDFMINVDVGWRIDVTPAGYSYEGKPPCAEGCKAPRFTMKHGFAACTGLNGSVTVDAMNDAGLALGLLWHETHPFELPYRKEGPAQAIAWVDLPEYIMGNFQTVQQVVVFLGSDDVQVTTDLPPQPYMHVLGSLGFRPTQIPLHLALQDAKGDTALIEFSASGPLISVGATVVTNDPPYPDHQTTYQRYMEAVDQSVATNSSIDPLPGPPIGYPRVPGSFESLARDVRLRMLLSAACYEGGEYPTSQSWAPRHGGISDAMAAAMSILRAVEVPWGATGAPVPGKFTAGDTEWSVLRDHANAFYIYHTPGNPRWQGFHLKDMDWAAMGGKTATYEFLQNYKDWYGDLTVRSDGASSAKACPQTQPDLAVA